MGQFIGQLIGQFIYNWTIYFSAMMMSHCIWKIHPLLDIFFHGAVGLVCTVIWTWPVKWFQSHFLIVPFDYIGHFFVQL